MLDQQAGFRRLMIGPAGSERRRLGNASLLNAMDGEIDDMKVNGIVIRCAQARAGSGEATTATA